MNNQQTLRPATSRSLDDNRQKWITVSERSFGIPQWFKCRPLLLFITPRHLHGWTPGCSHREISCSSCWLRSILIEPAWTLDKAVVAVDFFIKLPLPHSGSHFSIMNPVYSARSQKWLFQWNYSSTNTDFYRKKSCCSIWLSSSWWTLKHGKSRKVWVQQCTAIHGQIA